MTRMRLEGYGFHYGTFLDSLFAFLLEVNAGLVGVIAVKFAYGVFNLQYIVDPITVITPFIIGFALVYITDADLMVD